VTFRRSLEVLPGGLALALGVAVWFFAGTFPELDDGYPGPGLFPRIIAVGLALSGLGLLIRAFRRPGEASPATNQTPLLPAAARVAAGLALVALYPLLQGLIGFIPTVSALSFGVAVLLGVGVVTAGVTAIVSSSLIYLLFTRLLGVPL